MNPWTPEKPGITKKTKKIGTTKNGSTLLSNTVRFSEQSVYHARKLYRARVIFRLISSWYEHVFCLSFFLSFFAGKINSW